MSPTAGVDVSTVQFSATFPDLAACPGDLGVVATLLSPDGVRLAVGLPGDETRETTVSGQDLVLTYVHLSNGEPAPWLLGGGLVETQGERLVAPGDPPLVGTTTDFRRSLGTLVGQLFRAVEGAGLDPVHATRQYLTPHDDLDVAAVYEQTGGGT